MGENGNLGKKCLLLVVNGVNSGRRSHRVRSQEKKKESPSQESPSHRVTESGEEEGVTESGVRSHRVRSQEKKKEEEGRRKKEEGRRKKEEGRRKKEEGRRRKFLSLLFLLLLSCQRAYTLPFHAPPRPCQCCNAESVVIEVYKKAMMGKLKAKTGEHL
jgi:hypothetical protein